MRRVEWRVSREWGLVTEDWTLCCIFGGDIEARHLQYACAGPLYTKPEVTSCVHQRATSPTFLRIPVTITLSAREHPHTGRVIMRSQRPLWKHQTTNLRRRISNKTATNSSIPDWNGQQGLWQLEQSIGRASGGVRGRPWWACRRVPTPFCRSIPQRIWGAGPCLTAGTPDGQRASSCRCRTMKIIRNQEIR